MTQKSKILLVEDEVELREIISMVLDCEIENCEIVEAGSGKEAISLIEKDKFDFIVSDYTMHDGTGGDLFNYLREKEIKIPFLLLTGGFIEDYPEFADANNVDFFHCVHYKPFDSEKLIEQVQSGLEVVVGGVKDSVEAQYFEFPIQVFEKISYLHIDAYTKLGPNKFVKFLSADDVNPIQQFIHFKEKKLNSVYIHKNDLTKFLIKAQEFLVDKFSLKARVFDNVEAGNFVFEFSKVALDLLGVSKQVYGVVNEQVAKISKDVAKTPSIKELLGKANNGKNYLSSHCIMQAYLTVHLLRKLNITEEKSVRKMIVASLFHDIALSDEKLARNQHLELVATEKERNILKNHPALACEIIEKLVPVGEEDIFNIIKHHHEKPDGTGFPKKLNNQNLPLFSSVFILSLSVVDYLFQSNFYLKGLGKMVQELPEPYQSGNFARPYRKLLDLIEENDAFI